MKFLLTCISILFYSLSWAQLCPGSLGDPIINVTFGQNPPRARPLSPNINSYSFTGGCPNKGQYTINNFIYGCGGGTWLQTIGDHTGDVDGNYLMVNAEGTPGTVYDTVVTNLCGNTTYQFSVWVMNVMKPSACNNQPVHPNLLLYVTNNTDTLATTSTGDIRESESKIWKEYGVCLTTPANVNSLELKIATNPGPGCGSAFMIDDITLKTSGPKVDILLDNVNTDFDVCSGYTNPFLFTGKYSAGFNDPVVQWQQSADSGRNWSDIPGATSLSYRLPRINSGVFKFRMITAERANINSPHCRIASNNITINVHLIPNQQQSFSQTGCTGLPFQLIDTSFSSSYHLTYQWTGPGGYQSKLEAPTLPSVTFADSGRYLVKLTTDFGCSETDTINLKVVTGSQVVITPMVSNICEGDSVKFSAFGDGTYLWTPATGLSSNTIANPIATPKDSVKYLVQLTNPSGCKSVTEVVINVFKAAFANAGPDQVIFLGDSIHLNGTVSGSGINYYWTPATYMDDPKSLTPLVYPPADMVYTLYAVSSIGCGIVSSNVTVKVFKDVYIPSAFSPNGDGRNDVFTITAPGNFNIKQFEIFNRQGISVYRSSNNKVSWDGTYKGEVQPSGIYVYVLQMDGPNNKSVSRKGTLLLIR